MADTDYSNIYAEANTLDSKPVAELQQQAGQMDYSNIYTQANALDVKPGEQTQPVEQKQFNLYASTATYFGETTKYIQNNFEYQSHDVADGLNWMAVRTGQMSEEEALSKSNPEYWDTFKKNNLDPMENAPWYSTIPQRVLGATTGFIPYGTAILGTGAAGGAVVGAPFGAAGGLPGMGATALAGVPGGMFTTGSLFGSARMYGMLRKRGLSPDRAAQYADNWGMFEGAANVLKGGLIKGIGESAVDKIVSQEAVKRSFTQGVQRLLDNSLDLMPSIAGDVFKMTEINVAQYIAQNVLTNIADVSKKYDSEFFQTLSKVKDIQEKFIESVMSTEYWEGLGKTVQNSIYAGIGISVGAKSLGAGAGHIMKASGVKPNGLFSKAMDAALADLKQEIENKNQPKFIKDLLKAQIEIKVEGAPKLTKLQREKLGDAVKDIDAKIDDLENLRDETELQNVDVEPVNKLLKEARKERKQLLREKRKAEYDSVVGEVDRILEAAKSKFVIEEGETQLQETKRLQGLVTDLIDKSDLPKEHKGAFLNAIKQSPSLKEFIKVAPLVKAHVDAVLESHAVKEANKQLDKQLKRTIPKPKGKLTEATVDFDWQQIFNTYRDFIKDARATKSGEESKAHEAIREGLVRRDQAAEAMDKGKEIPDIDLKKEIEYTVATDVFNLKNADSKYIEGLVTKLEKLIDERRNEKLEKEKAKKQAQKDVVESVRTALDGTKPLRTEYLERDEQGNLTGNKVTKVRRFSEKEKSFSAFGETFRGWVPFWRGLFRDSKDPSHMFNFVDLHKEIHWAEKESREWKQKAGEQIIGGNNKIAKLLLKIEEKQFKEEDPRIHDLKNQFINQDGVTTSFAGDKVFRADQKISTGMLIQLALMFKNKKRDTGLAYGHRLTFEDHTRNIDGFDPKSKKGISAEEALNNLLDPEERQLVENLSEFYNNDSMDSFSALIEKHVEDEFGLPMEKHERWDGPSLRDMPGAAESEANRLDTHRVMQDRTITPHSLIKTVDSKLPYVIRPAISNLKKYIDTSVNWMAFREKYPILHKVVYDRTVGETISAKNSPQTMPILKELFARIVGTRSQQLLGRIDVLDKSRGGTAMMLTGGKIINAVAQLSSVLNYLAVKHINPINFSGGLLKVARDPLGTIELLRSTNYMKNRANGMIAEFAESNASKPLRDFATGKGTSGEFFQYLMRTNDRWSHFIGGGAVYHALKDHYISKGFSETIAHEKAIDAFERSSAELQGSTSNDFTTYHEMGGSFNKYSVLFGKQITQVWQNQFVGMQHALANPSFTSVTNVAKLYAAAHAAQFVFDGIRYYPDLNSDDPEKVNSAEIRLAVDLFNPFELLVIGDFIHNGAVLAWNEIIAKPNKQKELKVYPLEFLPYAQIEYGLRALQLSLRAGIQHDLLLPDAFQWVNSMARGFGPNVGGVLKGTPVPAFMKTLKDSLGIKYENGKMVMPDKKEGQTK